MRVTSTHAAETKPSEMYFIEAVVRIQLFCGFFN